MSQSPRIPTATAANKSHSSDNGEDHNEERVNFFTLPQELRHKIFEDAYASDIKDWPDKDHSFTSDLTYHMDASSDHELRTWEPRPQILAVSNFWLESSREAWTQNQLFELHDSCLARLEHVPVGVRRNIRAISLLEIYSDLAGTLDHLFRICPRLEKLDVRHSTTILSDDHISEDMSIQDIAAIPWVRTLLRQAPPALKKLFIHHAINTPHRDQRNLHRIPETTLFGIMNYVNIRLQTRHLSDYKTVSQTLNCTESSLLTHIPEDYEDISPENLPWFYLPILAEMFPLNRQYFENLFLTCLMKHYMALEKWYWQQLGWTTDTPEMFQMMQTTARADAGAHATSLNGDEWLNVWSIWDL